MFGKIFQLPSKQSSGNIERDSNDVPLKAPFPPDAKNARELIKKYSPTSDERKDYRAWYKTYGPGAKSKKVADIKKQTDYLKSLAKKFPGSDVDLDKAMAKAKTPKKQKNSTTEQQRQR